MKKKQTKEERLVEETDNFIRRVIEEKNVDADCASFWYPKCVELLNVYDKTWFKSGKVSMEDAIIAFAFHAYKYAFRQR